jgi:hypothetical protein
MDYEDGGKVGERGKKGSIRLAKRGKCGWR